MCGLFGVFGSPRAAQTVYLGLFTLQHRGQESAGIVAFDGSRMHAHHGLGHVAEVFDARTLGALAGDRAIGHVRYSTTGGSTLANAQPLVMDSAAGPVAIAHNGNLVNSRALRAELLRAGTLFRTPDFRTTTDTEIILHLMAKHRRLVSAIRPALRSVRGAYSLLFLTREEMVAARDPHGFRPLSLGRLPDGGWVVSSETSAFDITHAEYVREIRPGEILHIGAKGLRSEWIERPRADRRAFCFFEYVYFARPDSVLEGHSVHEVRKALGRQLAREHPADADIVVPLPDSGTAAALGFSGESGLPLELALVRNHYVGRTFIQPTEDQRHAGVHLKLNAVRRAVEGRRIVLVDDSIIRGTTSRSRVKMLREAGAREIHLRISCPPTRHPCFYGIDFPTPGELIAARMSVAEIRRHVGVDSLGYLSLEGMLSVLKDGGGFCTACWSGKYPVPVEDEFRKDQFERAET
jgi:amidophosphoribosyltransferase